MTYNWFHRTLFYEKQCGSYSSHVPVTEFTVACLWLNCTTCFLKKHKLETLWNYCSILLLFQRDKVNTWKHRSNFIFICNETLFDLQTYWVPPSVGPDPLVSHIRKSSLESNITSFGNKRISRKIKQSILGVKENIIYLYSWSGSDASIHSIKLTKEKDGWFDCIKHLKVAFVE